MPCTMIFTTAKSNIYSKKIPKLRTKKKKNLEQFLAWIVSKDTYNFFFQRSFPAKSSDGQISQRNCRTFCNEMLSGADRSNLI